MKQLFRLIGILFSIGTLLYAKRIYDERDIR